MADKNHIIKLSNHRSNATERSKIVSDIDDYVQDMLHMKSMLPYIQRALDHNDGAYTLNDVVNQCIANTLTYVSFDGGFYVVQVNEFPQCRKLHVFLAGGSMDAVLNNQPLLVEIAKYNRCSHITMTGRLGWAKVLPKYGWKQAAHMERKV